MITHVAGPSVTLMIGMAAFLLVLGTVIWLAERRKSNPGWILLVGLPGLYLGGLAKMGAPKWLYIPGLGLAAAAYVMQIVIWRRQKAAKNTGPADSGGSA